MICQQKQANTDWINTSSMVNITVWKSWPILTCLAMQSRWFTVIHKLRTKSTSVLGINCTVISTMFDVFLQLFLLTYHLLSFAVSLLAYITLYVHTDTYRGVKTTCTANRKWNKTHVCTWSPLKAAQCSAVSPSLSVTHRLAPLPMRYPTSIVCPYWLAVISGVQPFVSATSIDTPSWKN